MSNCYCLPGKAGGLPILFKVKFVLLSKFLAIVGMHYNVPELVGKDETCSRFSEFCFFPYILMYMED